MLKSFKNGARIKYHLMTFKAHPDGLNEIEGIGSGAKKIRNRPTHEQKFGYGAKVISLETMGARCCSLVRRHGTVCISTVGRPFPRVESFFPWLRRNLVMYTRVRARVPRAAKMIENNACGKTRI